MPTDLPRVVLNINFEAVFDHFDEDGDGKVSPVELRNCMMWMGEELSIAEVEEVVESADSDGDGLLGLEDFLKLVQVERGGEEYLKEAFQVYRSSEGEDCITVKSLRRVLSRLGEKKSEDECKAMVCRFDLDGDGVISFDEFRVMMEMAWD